MVLFFAVAGILFVVAVLVIALRIARAVQREIDREKERARSGGKTKSNQYAWLGHIHGYWFLIGIAIAKLKFVYKEWKTAPQGSLEQFGWGMLLALIVAAAMFAIVKLLDRKLNSSPSRESAGSSAET